MHILETRRIQIKVSQLINTLFEEIKEYILGTCFSPQFFFSRIEYSL